LIKTQWSNRAVQWRQSPELIDELAPGGVATVDETVEVVGHELLFLIGVALGLRAAAAFP
jgi:hypothetical protein